MLLSSTVGMQYVHKEQSGVRVVLSYSLTCSHNVIAQHKIKAYNAWKRNVVVALGKLTVQRNDDDDDNDNYSVDDNDNAVCHTY